MKTYSVIFRKHFDGAGCGDDYPTDFLHVSSDVEINPSFIEMRPPTTASSTLRDHEDCLAYYCPRCKATWSVGEINPSSDDYRPACPDCRAQITSDDETASAELDAIRMDSAQPHMQECRAGMGEEEWQYEVEDEHAGYFESCLDRCDTVIRYRELIEA